ncbi:MAG TPA: inorganic phosphate transporter [Bryobacteraceae bacterium]|nr:inorganic phosphate transporter [Bryobacteraceae bacterium]
MQGIAVAVESPSLPQGSRLGWGISVAALVVGLAYIGFHLLRDVHTVPRAASGTYFLLAGALVIALGFEVVNGFHDTANAVATVIYTNSLEPHLAVVWSGICNLCGVLVSTGTVAYAIIALLPVDLILQVSSHSGFAMVFALLIAAILWNLGTWWLGLPASSSHTMVGSIIGVGVANQLLNPHSGASGIDWGQAVRVLEALLISPVIGFFVAGVLLLISKRLFRYPSLYRAPKGKTPPPFPVRALMVLNCTGVSFFHGSNDGQKGMGLIMLILIGTVPAAYALNHNASPRDLGNFLNASERVVQILDGHGVPPAPNEVTARAEATRYIRTGQLAPQTLPALRTLVIRLDGELSRYSDYSSVPAEEQASMRNSMFVTGEALRLIQKDHDGAFTPAEWKSIQSYRQSMDHATRYIPAWVKVAVALALGLGTMVGWRRVVVTVGEKIGKDHLTYAQGAAAGLVAMGTIFAANGFGLPVSTTHILSSGVAGTMAANGSGLRMRTVRNIAAGWVLTMPAAALLSALLYVMFRQIP